MKNKIILFFLFFITFNLFSQLTKLIGNFIMLTVDNNSSNFILYGRNSKNDKWIPLIFEDFPPTSFFKFHKDGKSLPFGEGGRGRYSEIKSDKNCIYYFWKNEEIKIDIKFKLFSSAETMPLNSLLIEVIIKNLNEERDSIIDFFLCLDTYLGEKENKHFLTDIKKIYNNEDSINKEKLPQYIQSYSTEKKIGINVIFDKKYTLPDRVFFSNWKLIKDYIGHYNIKKGNSFDLKPFSINDSAIFIEYQNQKLTIKEKKYTFILSMKNNVNLEEKIEVNTTTTTITYYIQTTTTTYPLNKKRDLDLINMNLSDLLRLLDEINKKIESGQTLSQEDVDFSNAILEEIKRRRK